MLQKWSIVYGFFNVTLRAVFKKTARREKVALRQDQPRGFVR